MNATAGVVWPWLQLLVLCDCNYFYNQLQLVVLSSCKCRILRLQLGQYISYLQLHQSTIGTLNWLQLVLIATKAPNWFLFVHLTDFK
jgi:hypothetical protein